MTDQTLRWTQDKAEPRIRHGECLPRRLSPAAYCFRTRRPWARNIARYYVLSIEPTLFAKHTLIRRWSRIGCLDGERLQFFGDEDASRAQVTLETWLDRPVILEEIVANAAHPPTVVVQECGTSAEAEEPSLTFRPSSDLRVIAETPGPSVHPNVSCASASTASQAAINSSKREITRSGPSSLTGVSA
jgi:predicted DNA-binding WGR domain protein